MTDHKALYDELMARVEKSVTGAGSPTLASKYVANALMEWPEGRNLLRRIVEDLDDEQRTRVRVYLTATENETVTDEDIDAAMQMGTGDPVSTARVLRSKLLPNVGGEGDS